MENYEELKSTDPLHITNFDYTSILDVARIIEKEFKNIGKTVNISPSESKDSWNKSDNWKMWHSPTYEEKRNARESSSSWSKPWSNWDWGSPTGSLPVKKRLFNSPDKSEKEKAPFLCWTSHRSLSQMRGTSTRIRGSERTFLEPSRHPAGVSRTSCKEERSRPLPCMKCAI